MKTKEHNFEISDQVINENIYNGNEVFTVVGIRADKIEVEGEWSGGKHNIIQKYWCYVEDWEKYTPSPKPEIVNQDIIDFRYWLIEEYCKDNDKHNEVLSKFNTHFSLRGYDLG